MINLRLRDIHLTYSLQGNPLKILNGINLNFEKGEMVAILGPSGSGKSTLLYIIGCMLKPTTGSYQIEGREIGSMTEDELATIRNRRFGFVFQQFHLLPRANLIQNLLLGSRYTRNETRSQAELTQKAKELLGQVGLSEHLNHLPNQLSGGQQQRTAIARALMNDPSIILADEPTGNLDSKSTAQVLGLLREINKQGRTVIIITHDQEVAKICDRVITVKDGQAMDTKDFVDDGKPSQVSAVKKPKKFRLLSSSWREDARTAWQNLVRNKSRSMLTMLGVTIGVAAVLSTITLGGYTREKILQTYESLGVNKLVIRAFPRWNISAKDITAAKFEGVSDENDIRPMRRLFPEIQLISPVSTDFIQKVEFGGKSIDSARMLGVNHEYFNITNRKFIKGRGFSEFHVANRSRVCVIGFEIYEKLFPREEPLKQIIQITGNGDPYTCQIIGVMASQTSNSEWVTPNLQVIVPDSFLAVVSSRWNPKPFEFNIQVKSGASIEDLSQKVRAFFNLKYGRSVEVRVDSDELLVSQMRRFLNLFTILLTGVALISLAVGGIGITNMMLVSVAERFKEIGLRKALGANDEEIRSQFLIESTILCALAGGLGIAMGIMGYHLALFMAAKLFPQVQFEWVFNYSAIGLAFACIVSVGLLSGLVPALRAQKLEIVEALRSE